MLIRPDFSGSMSKNGAAQSIETLDIETQPRIKAESNGYQFIGRGTREFVQEVAEALRKNMKLIENGFLSAEFQHPGFLVAINPAEKLVLAQIDLYGLFPLFYSLKNGDILISDSLAELNSVCNCATDDIGVIEFMRFAYTIGSRTLFKEIKRLRPGEALRYQAENGQIRFDDQSPLWTEEYSGSKKRLVEEGCELLIDACKTMANSMLMMSAGWDSRTLLAGAFAAGVGKTVKFYHHGDLRSRETEMVKAIAQKTGNELILRRIETHFFDSEFLEKCFSEYNNVLFPTWHVAGETSRQDSFQIDSVCAGIPGEILGGHFGPPRTMHGLRKVASTFYYIADLPGFIDPRKRLKQTNPSEAIMLLHQPEYPTPWYFNADLWAERFVRIDKAVNNDIEQEIKRYITRGIENRDSAFEAFFSERSSQYIAGQVLSSATHKPLVAPYCNRDFITFASCVSFRDKANNSLNRGIVKRLCPDLLQFPTAAILCKANRPVILQEVSRVHRKAIQKWQNAKHKISKGKSEIPIWGWANFGCLDSPNAYDKLIESFESPLWDKAKIKNSIPNINAPSFGIMGMLLRMKTLDLFGVK